MSPIRLVLADPALRVAGTVMFLQGAVVCSIGPYFSTLAVHDFGFGNGGFAVLLAISSVMSVAAAVLAGIRADQTMNRRGIVLWSVGCLVLAMALMTLVPGPVVFVLAMALLLPVSSVTFGQVFALTRLVGTAYPPEHRDGIMVVIRAIFAAPFVIVLPLWSVLFARGAPVSVIFPAGLVMALSMLAAVAWLWPRDGQTVWQDSRSGLNLRGALAEIAASHRMGRVLALGAVNAATTVYMALISLIMIADIGRGPEDVALYVGLVAGLEVPFMLLVPRLSAGRSRTAMILVGAGLYGLHVLLLPVLAGSSLVWLLVLPAAIGGAVTLTLPIAYLQDLLADRPGAGASLMAVQRLVGDAIAAVCFAVGSTLWGYGLVAVLGAAVSLAGAFVLWRSDQAG
jgi:MFS transporter, SET family, sugar efflux transporter